MSFRDIKTKSLSADSPIIVRQGRDRYRYFIPIETKHTTVCYVEDISGQSEKTRGKVEQVMRLIEAGSDALKAKPRIDALLAAAKLLAAIPIEKISRGNLKPGSVVSAWNLSADDPDIEIKYDDVIAARAAVKEYEEKSNVHVPPSAT